MRACRVLACFFVCGSALFLSAPSSCRAQTPPDEVLRSLGTRVEEFLRDVEGENMRTSVETLLIGSPLLTSDMRRVRQLQETIKHELPRYGTLLNVESLKIERI